MEISGYNTDRIGADEFEQLLLQIEKDEEERMRAHYHKNAGGDEPEVSPEAGNDPENLIRRAGRERALQNKFNSFLQQCNEDEAAAMTAYLRRKYGAAPAGRKPQEEERGMEL